MGPIVAGTVLAVWSHPGRVRSDAAFAMLAGVAPIPASSGKTTRYRLNRSGDRQLNRALHTIVLSRLRYDQSTRTYAERRRAQDKTDREDQEVPQALHSPPAAPTAREPAPRRHRGRLTSIGASRLASG